MAPVTTDPMVRRVVWLRRFVYAFVWLDVLVFTPWVRDHGRVPRELYRPLAVARLLHLPAPTPRVVAVVLVALLASSAIAALGRAPRLAGTAVVVLYFEWMLIAFSYGKVDHDRFTFLVALAVLPTVDLVRRDTAVFAVRAVQVAAVLTYLLSVYAKHRFGGGLDTWLDSTTLLRAVVRRGTFIGDVLGQQPWTLHVAQYLVVGMELASPLLLVPGRVGKAMLAAVVGFHVATFATVTILFLPHVVCLTAFLPLESLPTALRPRASRTAEGPDTAPRRSADAGR
ncbi:MAG: hypothetical protein QOD30_224 [Actinomycetota bacterium]|nr:hypothetical protein [Actinomycetota bacterium]